MALTGEYEPSSTAWVREQVEAYEASGGTEAGTLRETGIPIIVMTCRGKSSGKLRKVPLMRVEHEGNYALIASIGGAPKNPSWYYNVSNDNQITMQDGPEPFDCVAEEVFGEERAAWWDRAVAVFPSYADYAKKTERTIPVFVTRRI